MAQYPTITAGTDLTADTLMSMLPLAVWKTAVTARSANTTVSDDPDLLIALAANATYIVELFLTYTGAAIGTGDLKISMPYSGTATGTWSAIGCSTAGATTLMQGGNPIGVGTTNFGTNAGNFATLMLRATVFTTTTGNLSLQWAQVTSNATATNLRAGCHMIATRVA